MDVEIRHNPSFAVARITLRANEQLRAESGAMPGQTEGASGGVLGGLIGR